MAKTLQDGIAQVASAARAEPGIESVRRAMRRLTMAAVLADDDAKLVAVNDVAVALTGFAQAELLRLSVPEITGFADQDSFVPLWRAFIAIGVQYGTYQLVMKSGAHVPVEYAAATVAPGLHLSLMRPVTGFTASS